MIVETGAIGKIIIFAAWLAVVSAIFVIPTWILWNWLVPELFGLPRISFFQALGLLLLSGMLFRSQPKVSVEGSHSEY